MPLFRSFGLLFLGVLFTAVPCGAQVTMTTDDASGTSSFNGAGTWSNGLAPSSGNDYVDNGHQLRTPASTGNPMFLGNSLTLSGGAVMIYKGAGTTDIITVNNLILNNGTVSNYSGSSSSFTLAGNVTLLSGGGDFDINANAPYKVAAHISGVGALQITSGTQATNPVVLTGANTYQGGTLVHSMSYLDVQADGALGTGNVSVSGTLKLESGTTNNYIADTADLILSSTLATGAIDLAFTGTDTIAGLSFNGGTTFVADGTWGAVGSGAQFTSTFFEGTGVLNVVPEVSTWLLFLGGGLFLWAVMGSKNRMLFLTGASGRLSHE